MRYWRLGAAQGQQRRGREDRPVTSKSDKARGRRVGRSGQCFAIDQIADVPTVEQSADRKIPDHRGFPGHCDT